MKGDSKADLPHSRSSATTHESSASEPPPYSPYEAPDGGSKALDVIPGLPPLSYSAYRLADATVSEDRTTTTISSPQLTASLEAFLKFLRDQTLLPPKPEIHIIGRHKRYGQPEEDFNIRLDLISYLIPQNNEPLAAYMEAADGPALQLGSPAANNKLRKEAGAFWNASQRAKSFTINRLTRNWDTEYIEGRIRSLLSDLRYRGETTITFPTACSAVVVKPQQTLLDLFSMFSQPAKFSVDVAWRFANIERRSVNTGITRQCSVCDEQAWWNTWAPTLREAFLSKTKGWVGTDAWREVSMGCRQQSKGQPKAWGMDV